MQGFDIEIQAAARVVSGRLAAGTGPAAPRLFCLVPRDRGALKDSTGFAVQNAAADMADGRFELRGVSPGAYDLIAFAKDIQGRETVGRSPIAVGMEDLHGVLVPMAPGIDLAVRVVRDGVALTPVVPPPVPNAADALASFLDLSSGCSTLSRMFSSRGGAALFSQTPGPNVRVSLHSVDDYPADLAASAVFGGVVDGSSILSGVPEARYVVRVSGASSNTYVADVRYGGISVYDDGLLVQGTPPGPVEVLLKSGALSLAGAVVDARGDRVSDATVALVPTASRRRNTELYKTVRSDADGNFYISRIAPGEYKLFAWEQIAATAFMNSEFISKYESRGLFMALNSAVDGVKVSVIPSDR
jgi:hypothetical protein